MIDLLQVQGMTEVVFNTKDLITIGGGIIATVTAYLTLKLNLAAKSVADEKRFSDIEKKNDVDIQELKEKLIGASVKKNAMREEFKEQMEKVESLTHKRIDAVRDDLKTYTNKSDVEFKTLNTALGEIKGMLSQMINQK